MLRDVTADEMKAAVLASGESFIPARECSLCQETIGHRVIDSQLYWDGGCGCAYGGLQPREWSELSEHVNMNDGDDKIEIAKSYGLELHEDVVISDPDDPRDYVNVRSLVRWIEPRLGDACVTLTCSVADAINMRRAMCIETREVDLYTDDWKALQDHLIIHMAEIVDE